MYSYRNISNLSMFFFYPIKYKLFLFLNVVQKTRIVYLKWKKKIELVEKIGVAYLRKKINTEVQDVAVDYEVDHPILDFHQQTS